MSSQEVLIILVHSLALQIILMCFQDSLVRTCALKHPVFIAWLLASETFRSLYAVLHWIRWMNFNQSFSNISIKAHTLGDTFLELLLLSFSMQKKKMKKRASLGFWIQICSVMLRAEQTQQEWFSQFIWEWHVETLVDGRNLNTSLIVLLPSLVLLDKDLVLEISPDAGAA